MNKKLWLHLLYISEHCDATTIRGATVICVLSVSFDEYDDDCVIGINCSIIKQPDEDSSVNISLRNDKKTEDAVACTESHAITGELGYSM